VLLVEKAALAIAILALGIGALAATSTLLLAVVERREELALLAAIGWSPRRVARLILGEGLALSVMESSSAWGRVWPAAQRSWTRSESRRFCRRR
jgi:ABC-type lipoprotein release transport system permease subunit